MWDTEIKSLHQALKKAQNDLIKETNKTKSRKARDEEKELKKLAAKAKATAKAVAAPQDDGEEKVGIEAWELFLSIADYALNPSAAPWRQTPLTPTTSGRWEPDAKIPSLLTVNTDDISGLLLEGPVDTVEATDLPEWYDLLPSASDWLEKALYRLLSCTMLSVEH